MDTAGVKNEVAESIALWERRHKMFLYKGWQKVEKGTYWEPDTGNRIVMKDYGLLPANRKEWYFKLPESYLLIPACVIGLAVSIAMPYGIGLAIIAFICALYKILFALTSECEELLGRLLANIFIGYRPNISFFSGSSKKKRYIKKKIKGNWDNS